MIYKERIEFSVAMHCNLRCANCSHLSPFMTKKLPSLEDFRKDITKLSTLLHVQEMNLIGGEPLLNSSIVSYINIAKDSGIADKVIVVTNGVLLPKMDSIFWETVDNLSISTYPEVTIDTEPIRVLAEKYNVEVETFYFDVFRKTILKTSQKKDWVLDLIFKTCKNQKMCHTVHQGYLYRCQVPPLLPDYIEEKYEPKIEGFSIHKDAPERLEELLFSERTLEACKFCLGYLGKMEPHTQKIQKDTTRKHLDFQKVFKEKNHANNT